MSANIQRLFLDTCSCLHPKAPALIRDHLLPSARKGTIRIILPSTVDKEIAKQLEGDKAGLRKAAREVRTVLDAGLQAGAIILAGEKGDQFPDALFQTLFARMRTEFPLALLTQDVKLMHDILQLGSARSVTRTHPIEVWTIDEKEGNLRQVLMPEVERRLAAQEARRSRIQNLTPQGPAQVPFNETTQAITTKTPLPIKNPLLEMGDVLQTQDGSSLTLGSRIARGGEGTVFHTSQPGVLAKIYNADHCTAERETKLTRMIEHGLDPEHPLTGSICWPLALVRDETGTFRGYLMNEGRGEVLFNSVLIGTNLRARFPDWDRTDLVKLCLSILQRIQFLHSLNILIGDINPANILVAGPEEVYFLDTDSYQVEGWPCPVGTSHFTPPELQGCRFSETLRSKEHERFAVATLLFMILHAGKQPFAQIGSSDPASNIRSGKFPYCLGDRGYQGVPDGPWKFIWSNLSFKVKDAFFRTFAAECSNERRVRIEEWLDLLGKYLHHLESHCEPGHIERQLFPWKSKPLSLHARLAFGVDEGSNWAN